MAMPSGTTFRAQGSRSVRVQTVHPRVCGEQERRSALCAKSSGSSPRVRGTGLNARIAQFADRFIPACAGNSPRTPRTMRRTTVHPRVCGEQISPMPPPMPNSGSSPRVRGTVYRGQIAKDDVWFIPACAGNSGIKSSFPSPSAVHPRVCGEQRRALNYSGFNGGSSPRVRGTELRAALIVCDHRFIPACAGNRRLERSHPRSASVHPRVCGEQRFGIKHITPPPGSSPRVRGTVVGFLAPVKCGRFIPACAGNSARRQRSCASRPVHPRVCGEQRL